MRIAHCRCFTEKFVRQLCFSTSNLWMERSLSLQHSLIHPGNKSFRLELSRSSPQFCPQPVNTKGSFLLVICWYILVLDIVMRIVALNAFDEVTRKPVNQLADVTGVLWPVPFLLQLKFSSGERRLLTSSHSSRFYKKTISSHCLDLQKESSLLSI